MSEGNKLRDLGLGLLVFALVFSLGMAVLSATSLRREEIAARQIPLENSFAPNSGVEGTVRDWAKVSPVDLLQRAHSPSGDRCARDQTCHDEQDLRAQQASAVSTIRILQWTQLQFCLSVIGTALIVWGLLLNRDATTAATSSAVVARKNLEESERPLFFVKALDAHLNRDEEDVEIEDEEEWRTNPLDANVVIKNVGTRPTIATGLKIELALWPVAELPPHPDAISKKAQRNLLTAGRELEAGEEFNRWTYARDSVGEAIDSMRGGTHQLYVTGLLEYEDALGIARERGFCLLGKVMTGIGHPRPHLLIWGRAAGTGNFDRRRKPGD